MFFKVLMSELFTAFSSNSSFISTILSSFYYSSLEYWLQLEILAAAYILTFKFNSTISLHMPFGGYSCKVASNLI